MGTGIAQTLAAAGIETALVDRDESALGRARERLEPLLGRMKKAAPLETAIGLEEAAPADAAIEAVTESLEVKRDVFARLDRALPGAVFLATNTSSLSVAAIADATASPEKVVGLHFMNPAPVMKLVEVVRTDGSSDEALRAATALVRLIGKTPIAVADRPCFVVNRVLMPMINEAARAVGEGVASPADVDEAMRLGARFPMGPLHLADLIGLDVVLQELGELERAFGEQHRPAAELVRRVERGELGRKSGRGFFAYGEPTAG
jgi:3-hydroxybutyryl-CoA dehydrogenase